MQAGTVKGTVVDATGEPIIGANIMVKGTTNGCITDIDGNFSLSNAKGTLVVSFIGYKSQEIVVKGNETNLKVIQEIMGHSDISTTMNIYAEATA